MKNFIKYFFVLIFICLISLHSNAFPKKKHAITKDKIDRENYENVFISGYYYGFMQYCNYRFAPDKEFLKSIKGVVAYTNWSLFLEFNLGFQQIQNELQVAGIGWGGTGSFQEKEIDWKFELKGCGDKKSLEKVYQNLDNLIASIVLQFLLERDNYESNFTELISALEKDKKDDYSGAIQRLKIVSDPNYQGETIAIEDETIILEDNNNEDSSEDDIATQLKKLKALFEDDLISEDEYNTKKKELLDKM